MQDQATSAVKSSHFAPLMRRTAQESGQGIGIEGERMTQVSEQMSRFPTIIEEMTHIYDALRNKLHPVIDENRDAPFEGQAIKAPSLCAHADALRSQADQLLTIASMFRSLTMLIEL